VVARTLGFLIVSRLVGLFGLGPPPDARDIDSLCCAISYFDLKIVGATVRCEGVL